MVLVGTADYDNHYRNRNQRTGYYQMAKPTNPGPKPGGDKTNKPPATRPGKDNTPNPRPMQKPGR